MAIAVREAVRKFLEDGIKDGSILKSTAEAYENSASGSPEVPNLSDPDRKVHNVLYLPNAIAFPDFVSQPLVFEGELIQFVEIPSGPVHDSYSELNLLAQQERSDHASEHPRP